MTIYEQGNRYEVKVVNALTADGYSCWQARGSKGAADVIALKPGQVLLVQVKSGAAPAPASLGMSHAGWNALFDLAEQTGAVPVACYWRQWARRPYWRRLTGRHHPNKQHWPSMPFAADEIEANQ